jgi:hypothetical protein
VKGRHDGLRVLGFGDIKVALTVRAQHFSATAREKIEAAGGTCEVLGEQSTVNSRPSVTQESPVAQGSPVQSTSAVETGAERQRPTPRS